MTDGYVGNDMAIIDAVKKNAGTARGVLVRDRHLGQPLPVGQHGPGRPGEVHYILGPSRRAGRRAVLRASADAGADRYRVGFPPAGGRGHLSQGHSRSLQRQAGGREGALQTRRGGTITLKGKTGEGAFERKIRGPFARRGAKDDVLASLWARAKVDHLMNQDLSGPDGAAESRDQGRDSGLGASLPVAHPVHELCGGGEEAGDEER